jgi:hypothetical protein
MLTGGIGAVIAKTVVAPLDRIKILNQTGGCEGGIAGAFRAVLAQDGVAGVYDFVAIAPCKGTALPHRHLSNQESAQWETATLPHPGHFHTRCSHLCVDFSVGLTCLLNCCWHLDCWLSVGHHTTMPHESLAGFWTGNTLNCLRVFPQKGVLYMMRDVYKDTARKLLYLSPNERLPVAYGFACGSLAGATASLATYPLDLVRGRMAGLLLQPNRGILQTFAHVYKNDGIAGFYRGP